MEEKTVITKISIRDLVEFILRSGDLDNRIKAGKRDMEAMQEGSRIHRKIQKQMGSEYRSEATLSITIPIEEEHGALALCVEGRADGIFTEQIESALFTVIDEIKCIHMDLGYLENPVMVHVAQAKCYAYIYAKQNELEEIGIQMTYCNLETEEVKRFREKYSFAEVETWFLDLVYKYAKWAIWQEKWKECRNASIKNIEFPFEYRLGQRDLVKGVYKTILRSRKLFIEAPTGVGKTISTVFPTVKAMGEGKAEKIFYLTAKTITRTVAEDSFQTLMEQGLQLKLVTLTAKDKICVLEKPDCNPVACLRAKGHFDRVNEAVFDMLEHETRISREFIEQYAEKHNVCPFEMCLDVTTWADAIVCDYNYIFDPNVYLRRFFALEKKQDFIFLIDEAHNLVDRAREMYSAILYKRDFLHVKQLIKVSFGRDQRSAQNMQKYLEACNKFLLGLKRECEEFEVWEEAGAFAMNLMRLLSAYEEFFQEGTISDGKDEIIRLYMDVRHFINIHDRMDDNYRIYTDYDEQGEFRMKLLCLDPSIRIRECLEKGKSAVFFSATLLPIRYYMEQLGGTEEDYAIYAPSPFDTKKRLLMIGNDVSTKYIRRNEEEYLRILAYIFIFTEAKKGNYLVFFPSYQMMQTISALAEERFPDRFRGLVLQENNMSEIKREEFLQDFQASPDTTRIGFCVMGGIFSEGIDLKNDRLIGTVIVGTGLPMVCNERELFRGFYDERNGKGFDYAYLYAGMNKVLQSAGRVIRTAEDYGCILLLDERFYQRQYQALFPREWYPFERVTLNGMNQVLENFWSNCPNQLTEKL